MELEFKIAPQPGWDQIQVHPRGSVATTIRLGFLAFPDDLMEEVATQAGRPKKRGPGTVTSVP